MSNDNISNSNTFPDLPDPAPGRTTPAPAPVTPPNNQFLTEEASSGAAGDSRGTEDVSESNLSKVAGMSKDLAEEGQHSAAEVMDTAKQEANMVAGQAKEQASHLLEELGADLREQTSLQQQKVATNLRDISDEFRSMLDQSQASGTAATLVDQASHHSGNIADWLEQREPGDLVDEVKQFARKRPGAFLGIALGAGLLAGRITRNAGNSKQQAGRPTEPASPHPSGVEPVGDSSGQSPLAPSAPLAAPPLTPQTDPSVLPPSSAETVGIDPLRSYPGEDPRAEDYK